ncbi:PTS mannose transporter subunit IIAB, partial [bacterium]|nr:PTS mannose transporter subunit IIAB [bacterium]
STSDPTIVFVDLCGGSTFMACATLPGERNNCALVAGVNLPMLLSFFTKRDKLSLSELAETVQKDGIRGILSSQVT